jgi:hypothetical protein
MAFHPWPYGDVVGKLAPIAGWWTTLHTVQFVLFPFVAASIWLLLDDLSGVDVVLARMGAVVFAIFYDIGDAIAGIATGVVAGRIPAAPPGERAGLVAGVEALFSHPVKNLSFEVGIYGWMLALVAAGVALWRVGAPRAPVVLLLVPAYSMGGFGDHAFPYGPITFASFFLCALWIELAPWRSSAASSRTAPQPPEPARVR